MVDESDESVCMSQDFRTWLLCTLHTHARDNQIQLWNNRKDTVLLNAVGGQLV